MPSPKYDEPRDEEHFPATCKAADGKTTLHRFRVDAVIYARSRGEAKRAAEEASLYLSAARVVS
jgi:hypothetical protein